MKKITVLLALMLFLTACGNEKENEVVNNQGTNEIIADLQNDEDINTELDSEEKKEDIEAITETVLPEVKQEEEKKVLRKNYKLS